MSAPFAYVCNTCNYFAKTVDDLKFHYNSDWHRYNLKRKNADMPPVTLENFELRVAELKKKEAAESIKNMYKCPYTGKVFKSEGAWKTYLKSKKYAQIVAKHAKQSDKPTPDTVEPLKPESAEKQRLWKEGDSPQKRWLYKMWVEAGDEEENWEDCSGDEMSDGEAETVPESSTSIKVVETEEMSDSDEDEGIENPDAEFGEAPVSLEPIKPLHDFFDFNKTRAFGSEEELLETMEKRYQFTIPARKHVSDLTGLLEHIATKIGAGMTCIYCNKGFYSLEAVQKHMRETPGHCRLNITGDNALELEDFYNFEDLEDEQEFIETLEVDNMQLVLPSGAKVGHKDMAKYYKQKFDYVPTGMEYSQLALNRARMGGSNKSRVMLIEQVLGRYKAIGYHQSTLAIKNENRDIRRVQRIRKSHDMRLGIRHNKVLQKHFRLQYQNAG